MQDEDWENVQLSLIAGLPVSFVHDLYTPRYIRRPVVQVQETTGVLPPVMEEGIPAGGTEYSLGAMGGAGAPAAPAAAGRVSKKTMLASQRLSELGVAAPALGPPARRTPP